MQRILVLALFCFTLIATVATLYGDDQQRGTLIGRFVYDGDPPPPKRIKTVADKKFCGTEVPDERLVVNSRNRGVANVIISLAEKDPPKHPREDELRTAHQIMFQQNCRYEPRVQTLLVGQRLTIENKDPMGHNSYIQFFKNPPKNIMLPSSARITFPIDHAETEPVLTVCGIHPWMRGILVIADHPYLDVSDSNGEFVIRDLPHGDWTFRVWHEAAGYVQKVKRDDRDVDWPKGKFSASITADLNDLGEIWIPASTFRN